ncbi:MAG: hypothetical protein AABZ80_07270 [Gemmatimonadota bacterium]
MTRRSPLVRFVTLAWASLQLAAPAVTSMADGRLALESASAPRTHVEATTSDSCPIVESPDCGLCRYLSTSSAQDVATPAFDWTVGEANDLVETASVGASGACLDLPFGRAPPSL